MNFEAVNLSMNIKDQTIFKNLQLEFSGTLVSRFIIWYLNKEYLTLGEPFEE